MKRVFAISAAIALVLAVTVLHSDIRNFLWTHPWWKSLLAALPTIAVPVLAFLEWRDSGKSSAEANVLRGRIAELEEERNQHLQKIAKNTERSITQAEKNANSLRNHLRTRVSVTEGEGYWGNNPEIVEVSDENIVTLFTPSGPASAAFCVNVSCGDLEITNNLQGLLRLRINKRHGTVEQLGEITKWEDRFQATAVPVFSRGSTAYRVEYTKPGSSETRRLFIYSSSDGTNSFELVTSTGETFVANNIDISKRFMAMQIDYLVLGFRSTGSGTGDSPHPLFISSGR